MPFFILAAFFALGALVASFVGVVVARFNTGQSFCTGRSRCDACNEPLSTLSLIPVISYLSTGGRARCCGAQLPLAALSTELLLGGLFALAQHQIGFGTGLAPMLISLSLLLALVLYDFAHQILPTGLLVPFVTASALCGFLLSPSLAAFALSACVAFLLASFLACIHFFSRGRMMGFADAPLTLGLGLLVGPAALPGFIFSFWVGAVIGMLVLAGRSPGSRMGVEVPFAPYLAAGFLLAYFTQWNPFIFVASVSVH